MGFGTGVDYRQSLWLPVSFCPKILKSNAFRHTISEVLNLLEGSDAIYGVIVTRHAADRMLERGGLNRKSIQRIANQVYSNGYPIERTKGRLRKWIRYGEYQSSFDSTKTAHIGFFVDWEHTSKPLNRKDLGYWLKSTDATIVGNIFDNPGLLGIKRTGE